MRKLLLLAVISLALTHLARADEITFSFIIGSPGSLTASAAGLTAGPAMNILVSDTTTSTMFAEPGTFTTHTGVSSSFIPLPTLVTATYMGSGPLSVLIVDPSNHPLVAGVLRDNAAFLTAIPDGTGAFLGSFDVTFVSPAVLSLFGLGPGFQPVGSVSATFAHDNFDGTTVTGVIGGGTVTIQSAAVSEPRGLSLAGIGLLGVAGFIKRLKFAA